MAVTPHEAASPAAAVQEFLATEDLALLEKPLIFERTTDFNNYQCCLGCCGAILTAGFTCVFCPIGVCCPSVLFKHFSLSLDKDAVQLNSASNDCCCHVATSKKTVPLEKIQDVELNDDWIMTMFGLEQVSVQTAGQGGPSAEIQAVFLKSPEQAREAIRLAVKLRHMSETAAPAPATMQRGGQGQLRQRLARLGQLMQKGVLSQEEMAVVRAAVLAADHDVTQLLLEAAELAEQGLITPQELAQMKGKWLNSL